MCIKDLGKIIALGILFYLLYFWKTLNPQVLLYSGKDTFNFFYPSRYYLYKSLKLGTFPIYTDKIFGGFPIAYDLERGYLNPINVALIYIFGPYTSYKFLHFFTFLIGFVSFWFLFKRWNFNDLGTIAGSFLYFFNLIILNHQQHISMVLTFYLIPTALYLFVNIIDIGKLIYSFLLSFLVLHVFTLGSMQSIYILLAVLFMYFVFTNSLKNITKLIYVVFLSFLFILPVLLGYFSLISQSVRPMYVVNNYFRQGSFLPINLVNLLLPFSVGIGSQYIGELINEGYYQHEFYVYIGIISFLVFILGISTISLKLRNFVIALCVYGLFLSVIRIIPQSIVFLTGAFVFRYWVRGLILFTFGVSITIASFFNSTNYNKINIFKYKYLLIALAVFVFLSFFSSEGFLFVAAVKRTFRHTPQYLIMPIMFSLLFCLFYYYKKIKLIFFLLFIDLFIFGQIIIKDDFKPISEFENFCKKSLPFEKNVLVVDFDNELNGFTALCNDHLTLQGYSVFWPKTLIPLAGTLFDQNLKTTISKTPDLSLLRSYKVKQIRVNGQIIDIDDTL